MNKLIDLDLIYGLFYQLIHNYIKDSPLDAKKLIIAKCLLRENVIRAILLREKIVDCL
jgi:hypothetical protein